MHRVSCRFFLIIVLQFHLPKNKQNKNLRFFRFIRPIFHFIIFRQFRSNSYNPFLQQRQKSIQYRYWCYFNWFWVSYVAVGLYGGQFGNGNSRSFNKQFILFLGPKRFFWFIFQFKILSQWFWTLDATWNWSRGSAQEIRYRDVRGGG